MLAEKCAFGSFSLFLLKCGQPQASGGGTASGGETEAGGHAGLPAPRARALRASFDMDSWACGLLLLSCDFWLAPPSRNLRVRPRGWPCAVCRDRLARMPPSLTSSLKHRRGTVPHIVLGGTASGLQTSSAEVWGPRDWPALTPQWPQVPGPAGSELHFWIGSDTGGAGSGRFVLSGHTCGLSKGRSFWEVPGSCKVLKDGRVILKALVVSPGMLATAWPRPHGHAPSPSCVTRWMSGDLGPEARFLV